MYVYTHIFKIQKKSVKSLYLIWVPGYNKLNWEKKFKTNKSVFKLNNSII